MDIFQLVKIAQVKVEEPELFFNEEVQTLVTFFRSKGVLPVSRTEQNGHLHYLFCATLVSAYYHDSKIYISSRMYGKYTENGISTKFLNWLDELVRRGLMVSYSTKGIAEGNVHLGDAIVSYIEGVTKISKKTEQVEQLELPF